MKKTSFLSGLLIFFTIIICLQSCTYDCPAFPDYETVWIPHQEGDVLKYFSDYDNFEFSLYFRDSETDDSKVNYFADTIINATEFKNVFRVNKKNATSNSRID